MWQLASNCIILIGKRREHNRVVALYSALLCLKIIGGVFNIVGFCYLILMPYPSITWLHIPLWDQDRTEELCLLAWIATSDRVVGVNAGRVKSTSRRIWTKEKRGRSRESWGKKKRRQPRDSCLILRECHKKADFA